MNDNITNLEKKIKQRKDLLLRHDIEAMEKEFMDKKEKSETKFTVEKQEKKEDINIGTIKPGEIKKVKGKKKVKDVITLDIPLKITPTQAPDTKNKSMFGQNFEKQKENIQFKEIEKATGLPQTFHLNNFEKKKEVEKVEFVNEAQPKKPPKDDSQPKEIETEAYKEISQENIKIIQGMSKEEFDEAQKEIMTNIPSSLIQKMKAGFFKKKLQKEMENLEISEKKNSEEKPKETGEKAKEKKKEENILYSYEGKTKKNYQELNYNQDKIDFTKNTFGQMDLSNKYFSLLEVYNFLSSSNVAQISLGLRILYNLITKRLFEQSEEFSKQLYSFINALYFLIDHTNMSIRLESLRCFTFFLDYFFKKDYKIFKTNLLKFGVFYGIKLYNTFEGLTKNLKKTKESFITLLKNNNKDFYRLTINCENNDITSMYKVVLFYLIYVGDIDSSRLINKIDTDGNVGHFDSNQRLIKMISITAIKEDLGIVQKYIKNRFFARFILNVRGYKMNVEIPKPEKKNDQIYYLNSLLSASCFDFQPEQYLSQTDFLILAKILLCKLNYVLKKNHNEEDFEPMFSNDSQIKFFESKFSQIFSKDFKTLDYYSKYSLFYFLNVFFLFWYKANKYPKIIGYKKVQTSLESIISLFGFFEENLDEILKDFPQNYKVEFLYKSEIFLFTSLNYIKCFIKNHEEKYYVPGLPLFLIKLSQLINKGNEYYYYVYVKLIQNILDRKFDKVKAMFPKLSLDLNSLGTDLNFYLESNEELRKSIYAKKIFLLVNSTEKLDTMIIDFSAKGGNNYFPFDNNFLFQMVTNKRAKTGIKVNYLIILMILWYGEDYQNRKDITPFEILLRFILSFEQEQFIENKKESPQEYSLLTEFISNKVLSNVLDYFVSNILIGEDDKINIRLLNFANNKMILGNFFDFFDENINFNEMVVYFKTVIILLIWVHCEVKGKSYIDPWSYVKNVELICYENMNEIIKEEYSFEELEKKSDKIISFLISQRSNQLASLYETLMLSYMKCVINIKDLKVSNNLIQKYILKLMETFEVDVKEYEDYVKKGDSLKEKINTKLKN